MLQFFVKQFKKESVSQATGIVIAFLIVERVIKVARGVLFARLLGPSEYGIYNLAFFFIPLAVTVAKLGIPSSYARYIPQYERQNVIKDFLRRTYLLVLFGSLCVVLVGFMMVPIICQWIFNSTAYQSIVIICLVTILPYAIVESYDATFVGLRTFKMKSILSFFQFCVFTLLGVLAVVFFPQAQSILIAHTVALCVTGIVFGMAIARYLRQFKDSVKIEDSGFYPKLMKYSCWFIVTPVVFTLFSYTDRWMLARMVGLQEVGIYSVAVNISGLVFTFGMIAGNVTAPNLSAIWEAGDKAGAISTLNFATKMNTLLLFGCALILYFLKGPFVGILYGADYAGCIPLIGILLAFWLFNSINWTMGTYAQLIEKTHILLICSVLGLGLNIYLNYVLIKPFGILGAAIATTAAFFSISLMNYLWFSCEGLNVQFSTIVVCCLPFALMGPPVIAMGVFVLFLLLIYFTDIILSNNEKSMLREKMIVVKHKVKEVFTRKTG